MVFHSEMTAAVVRSSPPPHMTAVSVFMKLPAIVAFIGGVKCPVSVFSASIVSFLRKLPWPCDPSQVH
jgi:hypothetical protein